MKLEMHFESSPCQMFNGSWDWKKAFKKEAEKENGMCIQYNYENQSIGIIKVRQVTQHEPHLIVELCSLIFQGFD